MKKLLLPILLLLVFMVSACSGESEKTASKSKEKTTESETVTYESETGAIEVPKNPERVVVLAPFLAGRVMALDTHIIGVDQYSKMNPRYKQYVKDVAEVSDENLEKIIELEPDVIIASPDNKNLDKLKEIAPTVTYTYGKLDYLTQFLEIGKLLNKEKEAQTWIDDFKVRAQKTGDEIKAKIGEDATVSVIEQFDKQLYVYGDNWGRGTEILYQEMKLKMPDKVKEHALKDGYYALSLEVLPEFAGDYIIFSKNSDADHSFQETDTYKNIPAVKNDRVFEANAKEFYFNDPITLDFQLEFFKEHFLGQ